MKKLLLLSFLLLFIGIGYKIISPLSFGDTRLAKYGVEYILNFELFEVDGVDFRTDAADAGADAFIRKDQGAVITSTNNFADEGNTYSLTISSTEMQAKEVLVQFIDQSGTKVWLDTALLIQTYGNASAQHAFDLDTASVAQTADNDTKISTLITGVDLNADAITSAKIADNAIAVEHIAADAIGASEIAADAIGASELAADAIGSSEIATAAIDADAIATDAIGAAEIASAAIGADEIATDAIGAAEIAADAIGASELAADSITSSELAASAATEITDDWESQSQTDPTGFHVNVKEVNGTAQTANDNGADINLILTDTTEIGVAGAGLTNINLPNQTMDIVGDITGNLSGSVGSVTGHTNQTGDSFARLGAPAGASVSADIAAIEGQTDDIGTAGAGLTDLGGMSTGMKGEVNTEVDNALDTALPASPTTGSINDVLDRQEEGIVYGAATAGTLSTTEMTTDISITIDDQFNGRILTFRKDTATADLQGQQTDITDTTASNDKLTFTAITTAPQVSDVFDIN